MKKTILKTVSKKFIPVFIIASSLAVIAPVAGMASSGKNIEILSSENAASVKFAGSAADALLFDVNIKNNNGDKFSLIIQNGEGEVLFSKDYTDKNFSKKIKLLKGDNSESYIFSIRSENKSLEKSFAISTATKVVDDVVVTQL